LPAVLVTLVALLACLPVAHAKGPISVEVCGANGCREIQAPAHSPGLTAVFEAQARPHPPPTEATGWFDVTMDFGGPERFALLQDPHYIRAVGKREGIMAPGERYGEYGWLRLTPAEAEAHERLTRGLEPLPISELPHLQATAPELAAAVQAAGADEGDGIEIPWLPLGAALGVVASAGGFLLARRRRR
jgi:hypothetical protein